MPLGHAGDEPGDIVRGERLIERALLAVEDEAERVFLTDEAVDQIEIIRVLGDGLDRVFLGIGVEITQKQGVFRAGAVRSTYRNCVKHGDWAIPLRVACGTIESDRSTSPQTA
ncbi:hypothetical protein [Roseovarius tolerans]|uniref:hypothetical protein n=1 Tax=Roseovarius tolerans TaxID=74031 RepID=UPI0009420F58|nr:hypothetical protein [Roseovarius tolerans]